MMPLHVSVFQGHTNVTAHNFCERGRASARPGLVIFDNFASVHNAGGVLDGLLVSNQDDVSIVPKKSSVNMISSGFTLLELFSSIFSATLFNIFSRAFW